MLKVWERYSQCAFLLSVAFSHITILEPYHVDSHTKRGIMIEFEKKVPISV